MSFRKSAVYIVIWAVLAVLFAVGIGSLNWVRYNRIFHHGKVTSAVITQLLPNNHNTARYTYQVDGHTFERQAHPGWPNPSLDNLHVGQKIIVYYDREYPKNSVIQYPKALLDNETTSILMVALIFPTIIVLCIGGWSPFAFHIPKAWNRHAIELNVRLSPDKAMSRIAAACDEERFGFSLSGFAGAKPCLLRRNGERFRIHRRKFYGNSFHPYLFARIDGTESGSKITGSFAMSWGTRAFSTIWFVFATLLSIIAILGHPHDKRTAFDLVPLALPIFGYLIVAFGKFLSRNEEPEISAMLHNALVEAIIEEH